ncbi:hypothetical protein [Bradyrhizobium sp. WD16]|uniref:hypothetical protein n=1 Tax=Bradyrhizobium sp. WD16 TaxID=1521768 RepID=UPI0020A59C49|nr:hypothetical protein [Bradyrhizobium sp. WD16]UTD25956.1 hypothetical protein DB459_02475 [Bradyrhizobium sp. WD16]
MKRLLLTLMAVTFLGAGATTLMAQGGEPSPPRSDVKAGKQKIIVDEEPDLKGGKLHGKQKIIVDEDHNLKKQKNK